MDRPAVSATVCINIVCDCVKFPELTFFFSAGDKYSIFKAVDPNSPSVFNGAQPQQSKLQSRSVSGANVVLTLYFVPDMMGQFVQPQQTGFQQFAQQPGNFQNNANTGFNQQNQQPYRGW